jgi:predicted ester cyclase
VSPETEAARSTEEVARAYFDRVAARDVEGMVELWEPGGIGHIYGLAELTAPHDYREWFANAFAAIPDMEFEVIEVTAEDDRAAVRWRARGTFNGDASFEGLLPTGAEIEMNGCDVLTIRDGRLVSNHAYTSGTELARQLGTLPPPGSLPERAMVGLFNLRTRALRALRERRG